MISCRYRDLLIQIKKVLQSHVIIGDSAKIRAISYLINNTKDTHNGRNTAGDSPQGFPTD